MRSSVLGPTERGRRHHSDAADFLRPRAAVPYFGLETRRESVGYRARVGNLPASSPRRQDDRQKLLRFFASCVA